ncbi:DUF1612 domain-containing protein [Pelagibius litoralis]|uniref:DUF1612 domain-containing protein n=1 Tax=Pelagibius litoralis TaxID=374515 RepID=A0A967C472_9PROT|nr:DUF1612 domain-containing protein [Pelagibius litoralis]NIA68055.1 DUF1612 domain-containing protein [Pelagibius litoralis]
MQVTPQPLQKNGNQLGRELRKELLFRRPDRKSADYQVGLPWESFARAWSLAEDRVARLEQQLSVSDLRHSWICRADFEEASALVLLDGQSVALQDLAMVDANILPAEPTAAWMKARALLSLRRHISRAGPAKTLTSDGIIALETRMIDSIQGNGDEAAETSTEVSHVDIEDKRRSVQRWLDVVEELQSTPALPAAAVALRVWRRMSPLEAYNDEVGLVLASLLLWHWGKTKGLTVCLGIGLREAQRSLDDQVTLGVWIQRFCEAVQVAANAGLDNHHTLNRGRAKLVQILTQRRAGSRLPRLAWLFLNYPAISTRFISQRLDVTTPGSSWLLEELIREGVVEEVTGKGRNRAYSLA